MGETGDVKYVRCVIMKFRCGGISVDIMSASHLKKSNEVPHYEFRQMPHQGMPVVY